MHEVKSGGTDIRVNCYGQWLALYELDSFECFIMMTSLYLATKLKLGNERITFTWVRWVYERNYTNITKLQLLQSIPAWYELKKDARRLFHYPYHFWSKYKWSLDD